MPQPLMRRAEALAALPYQPTITPALAPLIDAVEAACTCADGPTADHIVPALREAAAQPGLLTPEQRLPQSNGYARHLMHCDPAGRFTIVAIVWGPGQFSPSHGHHTWCAYAVRENALQETLYIWDHAGGAAQPVATDIRPPGYGCFAHAGLDQIHRLGNPGTEPAISIHVYGVGGARVATHVNRVVQVAKQVA
jgi:predicted metal-dependent enzyme (double-stranded beta helix superfamily)